MRIVKGLWRAAATVWLILGLAFVINVFSAEAWDCKGYNFRVRASGSVQVENQSDKDEPAQKADVFVNGEKVINDADVPAMKAGEDWTGFAKIDVPSGDWKWRVKGSKDCEDSGKHEGQEPKPTHTPDPTNLPEATGTLVPTETDTPEPAPKPTKKPKRDKTDTPVPFIVITNTPIPPTPIPTLVPTETPTSMVQFAACPITCCPTCNGQDIRIGIGSEVPDYSEVILEFKPLAFILLGILGANLLLKTYGIFRKD